MCYSQGDKILDPIPTPPKPLRDLLESNSSDAIEFHKNIRQYNSTFASIGAKFDKSLGTSGGYQSIKIHGETYHEIGTLLPISPAATP
jgi:hypothetical protein